MPSIPSTYRRGLAVGPAQRPAMAAAPPQHGAAFAVFILVGVLMIYAASLPPLFDAIDRPDITLRYSATCAVVFPLASYFGAVQGGLIGEHMARLGESWPALHALLLPFESSIGPDQRELVGVCLAWLVLYPLVIIGLLALTRRVTSIGVLDLARPQWPVVFAAACMLIAVHFVRSAVPALDSATYVAGDIRTRLILRLVLSALTGGIVYAGVLLLVGRKRVLADLRSLVREIRRKAPETVEAAKE